MIFDAIIGALLTVFNGVLSLIPSYSLPTSVTDFAGGIGSAIGTANSVFPVTILGLCIGVVLGFRLFLLLFAVVVWLYDKVPLKFT